MRKGIYLLLLTLSSTCFAFKDFTGTYRCKGYDPYLKKNYTGIIVIEQQNTVYKLTMQYDTGEKSKGTAGQFDDNSIAVVFQDVKDPYKVGLERYSVNDDQNKIQGYWVYLGKDQLGQEVCAKA